MELWYKLLLPEEKKKCSDAKGSDIAKLLLRQNFFVPNRCHEWF